MNVIAFTREEPPVVAVPLPSLARFARIAHIQRLVAVSYGIAPAEMKGGCTRKIVTWPRHVAMYLARENTPYSFKMIGKHFGGRDHSTVMHAVDAVKRRMSSDPVYAADIAALREALG